ncbi:unnamed protein product [Prunus armeniaca]
MASQVVNPSAINSIEPLTGSNFKKWKRDLEIVLGLLDHDLALREEKPEVTANSNAAQKHKLERWEKSNRICLLVMRKSITETICGGITESENANDFLEAIGLKFKDIEKAETGTLMTKLATMKYDGVEDMRVYLLSMIEVASKLKALKIPIADPFLVHLALNSLPSQFAQLKVIYNAQKDKWSLNELISICVQEEARMKKEKEVDTVHLTTNTPKRHHPKPNSFAAVNKDNTKANYSEVGNGVLVDGLFKLNCSSSNNVFAIDSIGQKQSQNNENSARLWHKRLGHVSTKRMQYLVKEQILPPLDVSDFEECIECIKGKMTNSRKLGSTQIQNLLVPTIEGHRCRSKSVPKTPFELWNKRKPSLNHLHIWGCRAEAKVYNPELAKLDQKTVSCRFIGYANRSKGFRFYCPNYVNRVVETGKARFIEPDDNEGVNKDFVFEEE